MPDTYLTDIFFTDENIGWVVGWPVGFSSKILKTTNGGSTWIEQLYPSSWMAEDVYFINANLGFIVGGYDYMYGCYGEILRTTNGGNNWNWSIMADSTIHWLGISFSDSLNGIVVGWGCYPQGTGCGIIFRTTDGGINWASVLVMAGVEFRSVVFTDANNWWVVGSGIILYTNDGGVIWREQYGTGGSDIAFVDENNGWAVGANGTILHTTNGGVPVELTSFTATTNGKNTRT